MTKKLGVTLFAAALGCSAAASGLGVPYRVADLNQKRPELADQVGFVGELSGRAIVLNWGWRHDADEKEHAQAELWASELASGAAEPIAGFLLTDFQPELLGAVQGRLLFRLRGYSPVWTTDGTRAGTTLLSPAFQSPFDNAVGWYFRIGDRMILADEEGMVWSTDGTPAGTEPLGASFPWPYTGGRPLPTLGNRACYISISGRQVVVSDGTAAGTSTLVDFPDGELDGLVTTADRLYFVRRTARTQELWTSDGSPGGTRRVRRFGPGFGETVIEPPMSLVHGVVFLECPISATLCHLTRAGVPGSAGVSRLTADRFVRGSVALHSGAKGLVFADGDGQLWRTDGTRRGTAAFGRCAGACRSGEEPPFPIARSGGRSLFSAPIGTGYAERQVWVTDGTDAGTRPLDARCARQPGCGTQLAALNGDVALLELTDTSPQQRRVARLDVPAVRPVPALGEGPAVASGNGFLVAGDRLTRLAADGGVLASMGFPGRRNDDAEPRSLIALGDRLVFTACDGKRQRIYWTDGAPGAVAPLADGAPSCESLDRSAPPVGLAGAVVVDARSSMVRVDAAGDALPILGHRASAIVPMGDALTLLVPNWECSEDDGCLHGRWLTDVFVSPDGSGPASQVATLPIAPFLYHVALGDRLLIADPATAEGLFAFRPSQAGAGLEPIRCPAGGGVCPPGELARLGDAAFLLANGLLWRIDGAAATRIAPPAGSDVHHHHLTVFDGALYFLASSRDDDARVWLYRSDGTEAGTVALAPIGDPDPYGEIDFRPMGFDGKLYFTLGTEELGAELWVSDGTAAGTHPFLDLRQGAASSSPLLLSVAAGRLFFAADDGEHGVELWSTDGVAEHTAMVADIAPGPLSSWPGRPVLAGGTLYFAADDGIAGSELWAVPVTP
ncbi:MAG TPA: hypothetical protein VF789_19315 [Thermoanaerobaculia bacterium]